MLKIPSLLLSFLILTFSLTAHAEYTTRAKQAIVVDFETGQILLEKNANDRMPTSSMSKLMTAYAVFDAMHRNEITLEDKFVVSKKAWKKGGSKMFVEVDKHVSVDDLLKGILIQSGNDATIVIAEGLSGEEDYFAEHITALAKSMGMNNSNFKNASGWPDPDHYSTAYDLSILARSIWKNYPQYSHYFTLKEFTFSNITQKNRNPLLYRNIGADGMKTGHTDAGGYGLVGSGVHNDRRVIVVINGLKSSKARAQEGARLLEWGLRRFKYQDIYKGNTAIKSATVKFSKEKEIQIGVATNIKLALPLSMGAEITKDVKIIKNLISPINVGDKVGEITLTIPEQEPLSYPLIALTPATERGFIGKSIEMLMTKFNDSK